jgi:hypothetical protein
MRVLRIRPIFRRVTLVVAATLALGVGAVSGAPAAGARSAAPDPTSSSTAPPTTVIGQNRAAGPFYRPPDPLPKGKPGEIIRSEPLTDVPAGTRGWRVLYHSRGLQGEDIAVSGMVLAPASAAKAKANRPIVSWAHPTTGVADTCAPSVLPNGPSLIAGLNGFIDAGYVVAATDYQGLGTPGVHPYLVGVSEGRGTLDAARAARNLKATGAGKKLFAWGHSQGGQGALFAGQLARTYAPEFDFLGSAAAAPAGDLAAIFDLDVNTVDGVALGGWAMNAYYQTYKDDHPDLRMRQMLTPKGIATLPKMVTLCNAINDQYAQLAALTLPLVGQFYATTDPASVPPWGELLRQNSPGDTRSDAPIFIAQDTADQVVPASTTDTLVEHLCSIRDTVDYVSYPGLSHDVIGVVSAPDALSWMEAILAGEDAPTTCT